MTVVVVLLWIAVAIQVLNIIMLSIAQGQTAVVEYTPGKVAVKSFFSIMWAVVFALAALGLAGAFS